MRKNDLVTGTCSALGSNGEGIVRLDGYVLFVPFLLPGERALIRVLKVKEFIAYGRVEEVYTPAEERIRQRCPVFSRCGGCHLQHMDYNYQLIYKTSLVTDSLKKIGGIQIEVPRCIKSDMPFAYRNKLQLPIGRYQDKNVIGFYAERSHRIVPIQECLLHPDWSRKLIFALYSFMEENGISGYDEQTHTGHLRHVVIRELQGKFLITLVVMKRGINVQPLLKLFDEIFHEYSFYLNYNFEDTNVVFGKEFELVKGVGFYECTEYGITYEAGPNTFIQINDGIRSKLYEKAASLTDKDDVVIDCYSGGGLLTALYARRVRKAYGIEVIKEASECADKLAYRNGLKGKMENICGKVEEELDALLNREQNAVVVFDPPRSGVERGILRRVINSNVKKIIMISCNPATLARDLGILTGTLVETPAGELKKSEQATENAFAITYIHPYDMFPQTKHVETLVCLNR